MSDILHNCQLWSQPNLGEVFQISSFHYNSSFILSFFLSFFPCVFVLSSFYSSDIKIDSNIIGLSNNLLECIRLTEHRADDSSKEKKKNKRRKVKIQMCRWTLQCCANILLSDGILSEAMTLTYQSHQSNGGQNFVDRRHHHHYYHHQYQQDG